VIDERLQRQAREARCDPAAGVRLARSLERLGRRDEALAALLQAIEEPEARAEIARHPGATAVARGNLMHVDAAPIFAKPAVRWSTPIGRATSVSLLASEFGIVSVSGSETVALDPRTGRVRWRTTSESRSPRPPKAWICGQALLIDAAGGLVGRDLWTGDECIRGPVDETLTALADGVAAFMKGNTVIARSISAPTTAAMPRLWSRKFRKPVTVVAAGAMIVVSRNDGLICMDATSGTSRWEAPGTKPVLDTDGVVARIEPTADAGHPEQVLYTRDGNVLWRRRDGRVPSALRPTS
jgi:hypothetical protein